MTRDYTLKGIYQEADEESGGTMPSGPTLWRWSIGCLVLLVVFSVCGGIYGYANNWFNAGVQVVSPENVRQQFQAAYDDINALNAIAQNICTLDKARDAEVKGSDAYTQRESQVLAQEQNYQRVQNHYNAYIHDPFRAKVVRPRDLPDPAPTESESLQSLGCGAA